MTTTQTEATIELTSHDSGIGWIDYNRYLGTCKGCKRTVAVMMATALFTTESQKCPHCGERMVLNRVFGRKSETKKCSASCLNAKRSCCECSCAGANHGAGW